MSRLIYQVLFCWYLLLNSHSSVADDALKHEHDPSLRQKNSKPGKVTTEIQYRFGNRSYTAISDSDIFKQKIIDHAQLHVECDDTGEARGKFDKPLPFGWLYKQFAETTITFNYFDTDQWEIWVLPNVHCNSDRILTAISWMRSGKKGAANKNKNMHGRYRNSKPSFYSTGVVDNNNRKSVYCEWSGWLYDKNTNRKKYIDTLKNKELFTLINIYCHHDRVIFMQHGYAGDDKGYRDFADDKDGEGVSDFPFRSIADPSPAKDGSIGCSWQGWLLKDSSGGTWEDTGGDQVDDNGKKRNKQRWSYEKYFALDRRDVDDKDKRKMHGRVINPFCSKGVVTRLRAYCFYSAKWEDRKFCNSLEAE